MKPRGEITVFLSMCILCVSALLCVMLESARLAGSRFYFQVAVNGGLDTLFSRYHRRLWEEYKILALEYDSQGQLEKDLETYIKKYLETENWYPMKLESVDVTRLISLSDQSGDILAQEVLDYMKYGMISQFVIHPEEGNRFLKDVKEGAGAGGLTDTYSSQEKEVRKLEEAVKNLMENIARQEKLAREIQDALWSEDVRRFYQTAADFKKTAGEYPKLMNHYEKQAAALANKHQESRGQIQEVKPDLQEDRGELIEKQWNPYDAYIEKDRERHGQLAAQAEVTKKNLELLEATEELVEVLLRQDDDEDEDDWSLGPAAQYWRQYENSGIDTNPGTGDKEKQNLLDQVRNLAGEGLLNLVLPEGSQISKARISSGQLPSQNGITAADRGNSLAERVLINEYCGHFFQNALTQGERPFQYELEYILYGEKTDQKNLEKAVAELFAVREGLNLIHILSDSTKREQARSLALVITGSVGLAPLAEITACLIMGIWAMGEAIQDLRTLLAGGKVPLWKKEGDWKVDLEGLLDMGRKKMPQADETGNGLTYEGYLKLLLLKEDPGVKHMRMLDLIEINIRRTEPGFLVEKCGYRVDIYSKACGKHVFFQLPFVKPWADGWDSYVLEAIGEKAY